MIIFQIRCWGRSIVHTVKNADPTWDVEHPMWDDHGPNLTWDVYHPTWNAKHPTWDVQDISCETLIIPHWMLIICKGIIYKSYS